MEAAGSREGAAGYALFPQPEARGPVISRAGTTQRLHLLQSPHARHGVPIIHLRRGRDALPATPYLLVG